MIAVLRRSFFPVLPGSAGGGFRLELAKAGGKREKRRS